MRNISIWFFEYLKQCLMPKPKARGPVHILFCIVDHFEPRLGGVSLEKEISRVEAWFDGYSRVVAKHKDLSGRCPQYTFFYPIDEYTPEVLNKVVEFCHSGLGEAEVQLHHDNDTADGLRKKLKYAKEVFTQHGLLSKDKKTGEIRYGFIHGNWALDNSRRDGRLCGVNEELKILKETGCYADFTLPSAPSDTQTAKINSIYYAKDTPAPKSHDQGKDVQVGAVPTDVDLLLIQGPLTLNWQRRKFGLLPRLENGELSFENPPVSGRVDLWVDQRICVKGRPEWVFVKAFTHGLKDNNLTPGYFAGLDKMFSYLESRYNDGKNFLLHYVTAREMYNIVKAAEAGLDGNPDGYRDHLVIT